MPADLKKHPHDTLSVQENTLATAMLHKMGNATVRYALRNGNRYLDHQPVSEQGFSQLVTEFHRDPKDSLAWARESLMAISQDDRLTEKQKSDRLDRYLDAYTELTLKLDHEAFPPSDTIQTGVPDYIPDGFVDMGGKDSMDHTARTREMVKVDKGAVLEKYKPLLKDVFSHDYEGQSSTQKKKAMVAKLYWGVYREINYNKDHAEKMRGVVNLGSVSEGVCRHIALTFQVLAQAAGLTSKLLKCDMVLDQGRGNVIAGRHAANVVRINHEWYLVDPTNPDYIMKTDGSAEGRLGAVPIERPPREGERLIYEGVRRHSGQKYKYTTGNEAYWFIDQQ